MDFGEKEDLEDKDEDEDEDVDEADEYIAIVSTGLEILILLQVFIVSTY